MIAPRPLQFPLEDYIVAVSKTEEEVFWDGSAIQYERDRVKVLEDKLYSIPKHKRED